MKKSFEENIDDLEKIVSELENGDLNLDDSVSKFEEGIKISKECNKILEEAEKKGIVVCLQHDQRQKTAVSIGQVCEVLLHQQQD